MKADLETPAVVERYSPRLAAGFGRWLKGYFRRNFDGVRTCRIAADPGLPADPGEPILVYTNHPSWWDPIHFMLLASHLLPGRRMFGPFDAAALGKYGFFEKIGAFGIDPSTRRGAAEFLSTSRGILATEGTSLWITAQGEFSDPRERPVVLRPGVAHLVRLVRRMERGVVLPLAVEYPFWNERRPEALSCWGTPIPLGPESEAGERSAEAWNEILTTALTDTMDHLAQEARCRDPRRFETLVSGRSGVGGIYDLWRRAKAVLRGRKFDASHGGPRE
jgi:1-acyl-sn-glycerol-3-phosphate acyltransferase